MLDKIGKGWIYTAVSVFFNIIAVKVIAIMLGPQGTGIFSILEKFLKIATTLGTFGGRAPLTQGISSLDRNEQRPFLASVAIVYLVATGCVVLATFYFAEIALRDVAPSGIASGMLSAWTAVAVIVAVFCEFYVGILNGSRFLDQVFIAQMVRMLSLAVLSYPFALLIAGGRFEAYALFFIFAHLVSLIYSIYSCYRCKVSFWPFIVMPRKHLVKRFGSFSLAVLLGALIGQGGVLASRLIIVNSHGIEAAGLFEAAWAISATYVGLLLNSIGLYFLPAVSGDMKINERNIVIRRVLVLSTIVATFALAAMIAVKPLLVSILYSGAFSGATNIIQWMLLGELLKIIGWVFGIPLLATQQGLLYLATNSVFTIVFIAILLVAMEVSGGLAVVGVAYFVSCFFYFLASCFVARFSLKFDFEFREIALMVFGFVVILGTSYLFWDDVHIGLNRSFGCFVIVSASLSYMVWQWGEGIFFNRKSA